MVAQLFFLCGVCTARNFGALVIHGQLNITQMDGPLLTYVKPTESTVRPMIITDDSRVT